MKSLRKICLLFVVLFSLSSSCNEKVEAILHDDMAEFDQSFVPVLYHVWNDDLATAKRATFFLNHSWNKFHEKYQNFSDEESDIDEDLRMANAWLGDAYTAIDSNHKESAYVYLDHVRFQLMDIRRKQKINYFLDYVWDFDAALDLVLEPAGDLMWCLLDQCEFNDLISEVNYFWHQMDMAYFDATRFGFDEDKIFYYKFRKNNLKKALDNFNQAFEEGDGEEIAMTASILEDAYLEYLYCFGDFVTSNAHVATR